MCHSSPLDLPAGHRTNADPLPPPSPGLPATTVCHYPAASAPIAHSPDCPGTAASTEPPRHATPLPTLPAARSARTPDPLAQAAARAGRHRRAAKSHSGTCPPDTRNARTLQACGPASRSRDDNRSDASTDHATVPSSAPATRRTTPRSPPLRSALPPVHQSAAPAPSKCSSSLAPCCPGSHAPAVVPLSPVVAGASPATDWILP
jgi:hypothetical protein